MAWQTLNEMQTERNNAYHPEIVFMPNLFVGGKTESFVPEPNKHYISILYSEDEPSRWIFPYSWNETSTPYALDPFLNQEYDMTTDVEALYLEAPYLTLKNIGKGTAKDIQLTFSMDWVENAVEILNSYPNDDHNYYVDYSGGEYGDNYVTVDYDLEDGKTTLVAIDKSPTKITFIAFDEEPINVALPQGMNDLLSVLIAQKAHYGNDPVRGGAKYKLDLCVTLKYSDIQGNEYPENEVIPWSILYEYWASRGDVNDVLRYVGTSFYEEYLR